MVGRQHAIRLYYQVVGQFPIDRVSAYGERTRAVGPAAHYGFELVAEWNRVEHGFKVVITRQGVYARPSIPSLFYSLDILSFFFPFMFHS